jgi:hypothetical protein
MRMRPENRPVAIAQPLRSAQWWCGYESCEGRDRQWADRSRRSELAANAYRDLNQDFTERIKEYPGGDEAHHNLERRDNPSQRKRSRLRLNSVLAEARSADEFLLMLGHAFAAEELPATRATRDRFPVFMDQATLSNNAHGSRAARELLDLRFAICNGEVRSLPWSFRSQIANCKLQISSDCMRLLRLGKLDGKDSLLDFDEALFVGWQSFKRRYPPQLRFCFDLDQA